MPRANRCTGSLQSKLLPTGDGHGRPTKGCQQGGAIAPPQARHPRASRGVAPSRDVGKHNPAEAETVRRLFALYRKFGCVRRVKEETDRLGFSTKRSTTASGIERGGKPF